MEHGPLPPHERTWRHPSELAAEERAAAIAEPPPSSTRVAAIASGIVGLFAVGALMIVVTPSGSAGPIAVSATTTVPSDVSDRSQPTIAAARAAATIGATASPAALATPVGDGRLAVATRASIESDAAEPGDLVVRMASGRTVGGRVLHASGDAVVVELAEPEPGHALATDRPGDDDMVKVMTEPPIEVALGSIANLEVGEGTAVFDADGRLIGLCSHADGRAKVIDVSAAFEPATSDAP